MIGFAPMDEEIVERNIDLCRQYGSNIDPIVYEKLVEVKDAITEFKKKKQEEKKHKIISLKIPCCFNLDDWIMLMVRDEAIVFKIKDSCIDDINPGVVLIEDKEQINKMIIFLQAFVNRN